MSRLSLFHCQNRVARPIFSFVGVPCWLRWMGKLPEKQIQVKEFGMALVFKLFVLVHVTLYRLTGGRIGGRVGGSDILLLITAGRKTGKRRTIPLGYLREGESYLVTASAGGTPKHPGWYWNAAKGTHPVKIQIGKDVKTVDVREAEGEERDKLYQRFVEVNEGYGTYEQKTERVIPVLVLTPQT
jgi:deazaflavin-dependent oxidoreductase (nitroreductase family)